MSARPADGALGPEAARSRYPRRGQVYWLDVPSVGRRAWLVVSGDDINRTVELPHLAAARISITERSRHVPTIVPLGPEEPLVGSVLAGTVTQIRRERFVDLVGTLSVSAMRDVDVALCEALGLGRGLPGLG